MQHATYLDFFGLRLESPTSSSKEALAAIKKDVRPMYAHSPNLAAMFPNQVSWQDVFVASLVNGFVEGVLYDHCGGIAQDLISMGETIRVAGDFFRGHWERDDKSLSELKNAVATGREIDLCDISTTWHLVHCGGDLYCFVEISSDVKCSSVGFFRAESPEVATQSFEAAFVERFCEKGKTVTLKQLAEIQAKEEGDILDDEDESAIFLLPPEYFETFPRLGRGKRFNFYRDHMEKTVREYLSDVE